MKENAYGLKWNRSIDPEKAELLCGKNFPILKEVPELTLTDQDTEPIQPNLLSKWFGEVSTPTHLLIEGDNLHSLACLCYTHRGQVNIVYIDPPYNTGNKDFMYNDRWIDSEHKDRKSIWLSFMEKRLRQSKILLAEDGVIFISIDDNMLYELKLLCDEIFGSQNFVNNIIWYYGKMSNEHKKFANSHEYVLVYGKSSLSTIIPSIKKDDSEYKNRWLKYVRDNKIYYGDVKHKKDKMIQDKIRNCRVEFGSLSDDYVLYDFDNQYKVDNDVIYVPTIKGNSEEYLNFGAGQKPVALMRRLLSAYPNKNATVLDFFAGSGTTGHAVLDLNKEDGGSRQFILCTNNENNIMTDVCYPRIKKVMCGYKKPNGEKVEGLGGSLKFFKTDFVEWRNNIHELAYAVNTTCSGMLRVKENVYNELENNEHYEIYYQGEDTLIAIYKGDYSVYPDAEELVELKNIMNGLDCSNKTLYIFALDWNADVYLREEFKDWKDITLKVMPMAMINEYKSLFNDEILKK